MRTGEQNEMKKIGIIGAMELEVETLKSKMNVAKTTKKANMEFLRIGQSCYLKSMGLPTIMTI